MPWAEVSTAAGLAGGERPPFLSFVAVTNPLTKGSMASFIYKYQVTKKSVTHVISGVDE